MLIEFSVENFRSIKERQTFSMLTAGKVNEHPQNVIDWDGKIKLTKSAIVYGRNASGKSNLLKALWAMTHFVVNSNLFRVGEKIPFYEPYKLHQDWFSKPTEFKIDFIGIDHIRYQYSFILSATEIIQESLFYFPKKQRSKLFVRFKDKPISFSQSLSGDKKSVERQLLNNQLFLSHGANSNIAQFSIPYLFFNQQIFSSIYGELLEESITNLIANNFFDNKTNQVFVIFQKLISFADTGISSIHATRKFGKNNEHTSGRISISENQSAQNEYRIKTIHKVQAGEKKINNIAFDLNEESSGTVKLFNIGYKIINTLCSGGIIIIDELDKSLHPMLTRTLINLFHNPKTNPKNAQLIFATHDVSLLDNELFRRDQIWFTEKEQDGATKLYSLSDFKGVRKETPYDKWYLSGRFGAIPSINESELQLEF